MEESVRAATCVKTWLCLAQHLQRTAHRDRQVRRRSRHRQCWLPTSGLMPAGALDGRVLQQMGRFMISRRPASVPQLCRRNGPGARGSLPDIVAYREPVVEDEVQRRKFYKAQTDCLRRAQVEVVLRLYAHACEGRHAGLHRNMSM